MKRLDPGHAQLLIIDIQEKLLPFIHEHESVVAQTNRMIRAAQVLRLPITVSEQYPQGLGGTVGPILQAAGPAPRTTKMTFSYCADPACQQHLARASRPQVLLVGIETHVCVQQTALDLVELAMQPYVLADAVGSRRQLDRDVALDLMRASGVVVTTLEAAIFHLVQQAGTQLFKQILPIVR